MPLLKVKAYNYRTQTICEIQDPDCGKGVIYNVSGLISVFRTSSFPTIPTSLFSSTTGSV